MAEINIPRLKVSDSFVTWRNKFNDALDAVQELSNNPGGGGGSVEVQNEGTVVTPTATSLNFVGPAVDVTADPSGNVTVTVTGSGGSGGNALEGIYDPSTVATPSVVYPGNNGATSTIGPFKSSEFLITAGGPDAIVASQWQIASDAAFTTIIYSEIDADDVYTHYVPAGTLMLGSTYYVRVRYITATNSISAFSSINSFTTTLATAEQFDKSRFNINFQDFALYQNKTMAIGKFGTVLFSSDRGLNYVSTPVPTSGVLKAVAYNHIAGRWFVLELVSSTTAKCWYSDNDGDSWSEGSLFSHGWSSALFTTNTVKLALQYDPVMNWVVAFAPSSANGGNLVFTSNGRYVMYSDTGGQTFNLLTTESYFYNFNIEANESYYGGISGNFIIRTPAGSNSYNWGSTNSIFSVDKINSTYVAAGSARAAHSTNLTTWTALVASTGFFGYVQKDEQLLYVYDTGSSGGTQSFFTSDGITFTADTNSLLDSDYKTKHVESTGQVHFKRYVQTGLQNDYISRLRTFAPLTGSEPVQGIFDVVTNGITTLVSTNNGIYTTQDEENFVLTLTDTEFKYMDSVNGVFFAYKVGQPSNLWYSADGTTWVNLGNKFKTRPYYNAQKGKYYAKTDTGFAESLNGVDWTYNIVNGVGNRTGVIIHNGNTFSIIENFEEGYLRWVSYDSGLTWASLEVTASAYSPTLNAFVLGSKFGTVQKTTDYITFQTGTIPTLLEIVEIEWTGSLFRAVDSAGVRFESADGLTFTQIAGLAQPKPLSEAYSPELNRYLQIAPNGELQTSTDNMTWTTITFPAETSFSPRGICWLEGRKSFFLKGNSTLYQAQFWFSNDGVKFYPARHVSIDAKPDSSQYVAVGDYGLISQGPAPDNLFQVEIGETVRFNDVYWSTLFGGAWYAAGESGTVWKSADGINWTKLTTGTTKEIKTMCESDNAIIFFTNGSVFVTTNGITFTEYAYGVTDPISATRSLLTNRVVVVSDSQKMTAVTADDGVTWTNAAIFLAPTDTTSFPSAVTWSTLGNHFVVGVYGSAASTSKSADGLTWTKFGVNNYNANERSSPIVWSTKHARYFYGTHSSGNRFDVTYSATTETNFSGVGVAQNITNSFGNEAVRKMHKILRNGDLFFLPRRRNSLNDLSNQSHVQGMARYDGQTTNFAFFEGRKNNGAGSTQAINAYSLYTQNAYGFIKLNNTFFDGYVKQSLENNMLFNYAEFYTGSFATSQQTFNTTYFFGSIGNNLAWYSNSNTTSFFIESDINTTQYSLTNRVYDNFFRSGRKGYFKFMNSSVYIFLVGGAIYKLDGVILSKVIDNMETALTQSVNDTGVTVGNIRYATFLNPAISSTSSIQLGLTTVASAVENQRAGFYQANAIQARNYSQSAVYFGNQTSSSSSRGDLIFAKLQSNGWGIDWSKAARIGGTNDFISWNFKNSTDALYYDGDGTRGTIIVDSIDPAQPNTFTTLATNPFTRNFYAGINGGKIVYGSEVISTIAYKDI